MRGSGTKLHDPLGNNQNREAEHQKQQLLKEICKHEAVEEELRKFTRRLLTARDEEQRQIASELHENMAQLVAKLIGQFRPIICADIYNNPCFGCRLWVQPDERGPRGMIIDT